MLQFDLKKRYGTYSLHISEKVDAEWLVMLAPSGAGKSLALNLISGIVRPDAGRVVLNGEVLFDSSPGSKPVLNRPIRHRRIGYLFQDYALFPHLTVAANIAYGLPRDADRKKEVGRWMRFFRLEGRERAFPRHLSGGQRQRVALARTLASAPRALLLDEPFSALDRRIREVLYREVERLKEELSLPVILVTHDLVEAQLLGDRVAVLEEGRVVETGSKERIFTRPRRHETARFLGVENVFPASVLSIGKGGGLTVECRGNSLMVEQGGGFAVGASVYLCVHASDVRLLLQDDGRSNSLPVRIEGIHPQGGTNRVLVAPASPREENAPRFVMLVDDYVVGRHELTPGKTISIWLPVEKLFLCE